MNRNISRVLLVISPLMIPFGPANADTSSMDSALMRSEQCFAESIPVFGVVLQEFETSYLECLLHEETAIGKPYGRRDQNSQYVIVAPVEDDGGLYENYAVEKCQNASKRAYVENTARNFKVLDSCLRSTESLVSTTTEMTTSTTTEKSVQPPKDSGATSILNTNVSYLFLGMNILKYTLHS